MLDQLQPFGKIALAWLRKIAHNFRHPNYIYVHYLWILTVTLTGSVIIYGDGTLGLEYIDALFFACGSATQSGLNTVDVNTIYLYQQIAIYCLTMMSNPIFVNTMVVEWRLRGFANRFKEEERRQLERYKTRERSRTSIDKERNRSMELAERGQLHGSGEGPPRRKSAPEIVSESVPRNDSTQERTSSSASDDKKPVERPTTPNQMGRTITFAETPSPNRLRRESTNQPERFVQPRPMNDHIAFVERQRNDSNAEDALFIPDPRAVERGEGPREIQLGLHRVVSGEDRGTANGPSVTFRATDTQNAKGHPRNTPDDRPSYESNKLGRIFSRPKSAGRSTALHTSETNDGHGSAIRRRSETFRSYMSTESRTKDMPYLTYTPTVGRNSTFVGMSEEQREELGGLEYRSLKTLRIILWSFFGGFHLFGAMGLMWIYTAGPTYDQILATNAITSPAWWAFFTAGSMFNDLGFTLTADSMNSFNYAVWPLILGSYLIVIGNTGFPIMLRFVIWITSLIVGKVRGEDVPTYEELRFLLDHPRRCFTLLFPSKETWWLFGVLVILNGLDLLFFCVLDLSAEAIVVLPDGIKVLDGLFQAVSTRTAGFSVVNISALHNAVQVSYLIMMYISVLPIAISVRRTNVYEEQSLGIYHSRATFDEDNLNRSFVKTHLRHQLSYDLWYIFLGLFFIAIVEGKRLENTNEYAFSLFSVLFEIVSAYGTVGLSLGYPGTNASFSAQFHTLSKLIIIAMQIRGRHRGLPYALDRAVMLPTDKREREANEILQGYHRSSTAIGEGDEPGLPRTMTGRSRRDSQTGLARRVTTTAGNFISGALLPGPSISKDHNE